MTGLKVRLARKLNRLFDRKGSIFAERYHVHVLRSPTEVRHALRYVLLNHKKHGVPGHALDPFSSAGAFEGWTIKIPRTLEPITPPKTWLLQKGWKEKGGGLISPADLPGVRTRRAR